MSGRDEVVATLAARVKETLEARGPGHCLQIAHVPASLADKACREVDRGLRSPDLARVVVKEPSKDWHATPAKIVEERNAIEQTGGRLALFVPAGQHVAAEDSFGRSTFEVLETDNLYEEVSLRLVRELEVLAPDIAEQAEEVLVAARSGAAPSVRDEAAYLARLVAAPSEAELGRGLVELGLLPDRNLSSEGAAGLLPRLERNRQQMEALSSQTPPTDRVQQVAAAVEGEGSGPITAALLDALDDGTFDPREIAHRLDERSSSIDFAPVVAPSDGRPVIQELTILSLGGDFVKGSDPPTIKKARASLRLKVRCKPAATSLSGLKELRLELMQVSEQGTELTPSGIEVVKRGKSLPKKAEFSWSLKVDIGGGDSEGIDAGLYRLRVQVLDEDNLTLNETVSDTFRVHEEVEEPDTEVYGTMSVAAARAEAACRDPERRDPGAVVITGGAESTGPALTLTVGFSDATGRSRLELSRLLARVERFTLDDPATLGYTISLDKNEIVALQDYSQVELPPEFLDARRALFEGISRNQYEVQGAEGEPLVALCDLLPLSAEIEHYVKQWTSALEASGDDVQRALLRTDQVGFEEPELNRSILVGPTHPLRIAWLWRYQRTLLDWSRTPGAPPSETKEVMDMLPGLLPGNVPHVLVADRTELRYLEPLDLQWGLWSPPSEPDALGLAASIRERLGLPRTNSGVVNVKEVVQRVRRYLAAHPYVDLIKLNFVQPGFGDVVLETLLALQGDSRTSDLRYEVRLFATDEQSRSNLGRALDEFMADPDAIKGVKRDAADAFLSSSDDPLAPKLVYSKHSVDELLDNTSRFPAHISFFLDWFKLDAVPVAPLRDRRSFFASGLIVEPVVVYRPGGETMNPQWDEHVVTPADPDWFARAYEACEASTSSLLGPRAVGTVPAVRLELDRVRRSILDSVHARSDWVVVIDPVFTDEYLDSPSTYDESPRYLIDSTDPGALESSRRIMVSTRSRAELAGLMRPVLESYELSLADDRIAILLDSLQALNAGLPLKLLNNRTQALEAFSLSLATTYLAGQGILRRALVIPLDMHAELFRERPPAESSEIDLRRTDLAVIQIEADRRLLAVHLVEVKARAGLPENTPDELVSQIAGQLGNSEAVLRSRLFSKELRSRRGSLAGALMVRRLTRLLGRYVDRAARYGFMEAERAVEARGFIADLDRSFTVIFNRHGLIFDLQGESVAPESFEDVSIVRVGRSEIVDMIDRTQTPVGTRWGDGVLEDVGTVFGVPDRAAPEDVIGIADDVAIESEDGPGSEDSSRETPKPPAAGGREDEDESNGPEFGDVWVAGATQQSRQFGVIGRVGAKNVAFDVDGTNVVSVFGVQGSGKSYTVGNLIEAGLIRDPVLNRLPQPLAGVVFHYSADETYLPEFAEMARANERRAEIDLLASEYGASPVGVDDVQVLVPSDLLEDRTEDFPGLPVVPLKLGPKELHADDWRLLMGVAGGDQLYVKALTNIFRKLRRDVSVRALRKAIQESRLNPQQRSLADQRLDFVEAFVQDGAELGPLVQPGRLLVVDVRDPYMEQEEVLSLFMVLLRLFSQARGDGSQRAFNKLIVFDEAHKYMDNPRLTGAIVETVREMRHKGTSVVIASQNPPSVPREVVELSSVIVAHKFTAPTWLEHIRKVNESFGRELKPSRLASLGAGEAFVWSNGGAEQLRRPQRVRMRPRLSMHGGATRRATGD